MHVLQSAVHIRGHGYSNSFTLYRGCTLLSPQDLKYPPVFPPDRHTEVCRGRIISRDPTSTFTSTGLSLQVTPPGTPETTLILAFESGAMAETLQYRPAIDLQQCTASPL